MSRRHGALTLFLALGLMASLRAQTTTWQAEFAKMPLVERPAELDRHNCARILLHSFQRNPAVQALIFMPGATDEFYFFRRARARLTNADPSLLDAIIALTNQTYIQATEAAPFLVLHTVEDPLEPDIKIENPKMAQRLKRKKFERHGIFDDYDWNTFEPILAFDINTILEPGLHTHLSNHFFRYTFAEYGLNGWDALRAAAMASKTGFIVKKRTVEFFLDDRKTPLPPTPNSDFLFKKD